MGARKTLNQAVEAQTSQVVRHLSPGDVLGRLPQQGGPVVAEFAVGKPPRRQPKHQQHAKQGLHGHVGETQGDGPLTSDRRRLNHPLKAFDAGFDLLMVNPIDPDELRQKLDEIDLPINTSALRMACRHLSGYSQMDNLLNCVASVSQCFLPY
jgi:hypothetical protein